MIIRTLKDFRAYCFRKHVDQKYGDQPYTEHLKDVFDVAHEFRDLLSEQDFEVAEFAAYGHDLIEDQDDSVETLATMFYDLRIGFQVATAVSSVSASRGANRRERFRNIAPSLRANHIAMFVKLCDRIANVRRSRNNTTGSQHLEMYRKEHDFFQDEIRTDLFPEMWSELERLLSVRTTSTSKHK